MSEEPLDAPELRSLLATILAGAVEQRELTWAELVGEIEILPIVFNLRWNWFVKPLDTLPQREAFDKAIELVQAGHPYIRVETARSVRSRQ